MENKLSNSILYQNNHYSRTKRDRGKNFLPIEREQLLQICSDYYDVIENKKTDSHSCKKKYEAWVEIAKKFNRIQTTGPRNDKHLKTLYDNIKRDAKKPKNLAEKLYSPGHYLGNATSLCNVLINEPANSYKTSDVEQSPPHNGCSNPSESPPRITHPPSLCTRINFKEEPSDAEPENGQPLSNSFSSKDSYTSECNYTPNYDNLLQTKENHCGEICHLPPPTSEPDDAEEYHKARLKYLEIEHKKKMQLLDLEKECLILKRDYLKAKLKNVQNTSTNETNNNI